MPRPNKGPRLYLRNREGRTGAWIIRDGARQVHTGATEPDRTKAEDALRSYITARHDGRPADLCAETAALLQLTQPGFVYFVSCDRPLFPIKIGFAANVKLRMNHLQCALPWPVVLLLSVSGNREEERRLHQRFDRLRMNGEWFARGPELLEFIERVKVWPPHTYKIKRNSKEE